MSKYGVGLRNVSSYLVSGHPYITGSCVNPGGEVKIEFPYVTKNITIRIPKPPNVGCDNSTAGSRFQTGADFDLGGSGKDFTISFWHKDTAPNAIYSIQARGLLSLVDGSVVEQFQTPKPAAAPGTAQSGSFQWLRFRAAGGLSNSGLTDQPNGNHEWYHYLVTQNTGSTFIYTNGIHRAEAAFECLNWKTISWYRNGQHCPSAFDEFLVWSSGFGQEDIIELYNDGEYYNPTFHSKRNNLVAWYKMGDNALDDPGPRVGGVGGRLHDVVNPAEDLDMFANNPNPATFIDGPFLKQSTGKIRIHMASTGSDSGANIVDHKHYQELQGYGNSIEIPAKTKEIYISGVGAQTTFEVIAELTNIQTRSMYALTGSGIDE